MVGVPARSRGCARCRKRKRGCDRAWPSCGQCRAAGVECGGYDKEHIFLISTTEAEQGGTSRLNQAFYSKDVGKKKSIQVVPDRQRHPQPSVKLLSDKLARSAFEEGALCDFWSCWLPGGRSASPKLVQYSSIGWANLAQNMSESHETLRMAVLTNAVALWAREKKLPQMLPLCQRMYGQVLRTVSIYLEKDKEKKDVAAILLVGSMLGLYEATFAPGCEIFNAEQMEKYFAHVFGFQALMMTKGPLFYAHGLAHHVFRIMRFQQVSLALQLRKRAPHAEEKWKTLPWKYSEKSPKDVITDIMTDLTGILEESDSIPLLQNAKKQASRRQEVLSKCWKLHDEIQNWKSGPGRHVADYLSSIKEGSDKTGYALTIEDCAIAELVFLYCIVCIMLYDSLRSNSDTSNEHDWPEHTDPRFYCHQTAAFVKFLMPFELKRIVRNMVIFAVLIALRFISRQEALGGTLDEEKTAILESLGDLRSVVLGVVERVDQASRNHHSRQKAH